MIITTLDIEIAVSKYFNPRANLIVPNVSWGLDLHEVDLLVLTKNNYAYEIEIKTSRTDLRADQKKRHGHRNGKISRLYFALPVDLCEWRNLELISERAGILVIDAEGRCKQIRKAVQSHNYQFTDKQRLALARLGTMRIWGMKEQIRSLWRNKNANHQGK